MPLQHYPTAVADACGAPCDGEAVAFKCRGHSGFGVARDFVSEALASGGCESLAILLQRKGLDEKLRSTVRPMGIALRNVRGSEFERLSMRSRFFAMRVWNGFSSLFFTLNPHDIRCPVTLLLTDAEQLGVAQKFSLDFDDAATEEYMA